MEALGIVSDDNVCVLLSILTAIAHENAIRVHRLLGVQSVEHATISQMTKDCAVHVGPRYCVSRVSAFTGHTFDEPYHAWLTLLDLADDGPNSRVPGYVVLQVKR